MSNTLSRVRGAIYHTRYLRHMDTLESIQAHPDFAAVRQSIRDAGTDDLSHFQNGYTQEGGLYLQQNPDEFAALTVWLKDRGPFPSYMEIGSASGGACLFLSRHLGFVRPLSIDDGNHRRAVVQEDLLSQVPSLRRFNGDSHSAAARQWLSENVLDRLDLAFVDGDHSYEGVVQDIQLTLEFCRPGTLMVLHDITACEDVRLAWRQAVTKRQLQPLAQFVGASRPLGIAVGAVR